MRFIISTCLLLVSILSIAQKKSINDESATEQFVLRLHEKKFQWMVNKQTDSLNSILDLRVIYVHSNGWQQNRKEITDDLKSGKLIMNSVSVMEAKARVYKGAVIINGKGKFDVVVEGKSVVIELLYTEVYVRKKEGWLLVSRHANRIN
ncbi:nuclear transport factor 2 family protein [Lacibacter sp. MH-610]|uniref:nuclear transport factor 2 family protein n=1 Tax=Lacibacter sp. MH-610 TaxID=3020883 RepID=UPI003891C3C9